MPKFLIFLFVAFLSIGSATSQCDCDYTVPENSHPDGAELGIKPGDVICLDANINYNGMKFSNIHGTPENPVIIRNCNGKVRINSTNAYGVKFEYSDNFKIVGNGDPAETYGISISGISGFYLTMEYFTTDFEIAHVEIAGSHPEDLNESGFAGIGIKTSPYQDCDLFTDKTRTAWIMQNISVHDNYIHDIGGEGMYVGHGFYKGRIESACNDTTYSHSIKHVRIYNNIIENTGYDGMQIKNTDEDVMIYNNIIRNYGILGEGGHNEGLFLGEGVTGAAYNNWIQDGTGHGIQFQGMGNNNIYNNVIINSGGSGFYGAHGVSVIRIPDAPFNIFNNTFINSVDDGFAFFNNDGGPKRVFNNLFINQGGDVIRKGASDLINRANLSYSRFLPAMLTDTVFYNLVPTESSPLIDAGINPSEYGINLSTDYRGVPRPYGNNYDVGAFERSSISAVVTHNYNKINLYPNPVDSHETISFSFYSNSNQNIELKLHNQKGIMVFKEMVNARSGYNKGLIGHAIISDLPSGVYLLTLRGGSLNFSQKIIVK